MKVAEDVDGCVEALGQVGSTSVSWIVASLLLGVAAQWLRGNIRSAIDGTPPRWAGRTRARSSAG